MSKTLTPEEYQQQFIDYYTFGGIGVTGAPDPDPDPDADPDPVRPDILVPVGMRDESAPNIFGQIPIRGTGQQFSRYDAADYINDFDTQEQTNLSDKSFKRYLEQAGGVPGAVATMATGLPISAMAYGAGQLARKEHRKNATSIQEYDGSVGDIFKFKGQTVSRAPGSKIFTGNLGGLSQADMYRSREIAKGFIPGTMTESVLGRRGAGPQAMPGVTGLRGVAQIEGAILDAFGTTHSGQRDDSGHMMVSASQAQALREQEFMKAATGAGMGNIARQLANAGYDPTMIAVEFKQMVDGNMKGQSYHGGFFHKTSNLSPAQNAQAIRDRAGFAQAAIENIRDKYGLDSAITVAERSDDSGGGAPASEPKVPPGGPPPSGVSGDDPYDNNDSDTTSADGLAARAAAREAFSQYRQGPQMITASDDSGFSVTGTSRSVQATRGATSTVSRDIQTERGRETGVYTGGAFGGSPFGGFADGGRVGMQTGGAAQRPLPEAGFVAGPPENFTERETIADDQNGSVAEGTFVINAAAVEYAGSEDIRKMILDAYSKAREKGLDIGRVDRKLYEGTVDVALSKGEVIVPPELAKIIGYDRLEKINNRGKKEVTRRQEKAGGGFLNGKKFADGGEVDLEYEDRIIADEVRRKMRDLVASLPDDVEVESVYYQPGYPAAQRYADEVARLNETEPFTGTFFSRSQKSVPGTNRRTRIKNPRINVPQTPTLFNLAILAEEVAHQDAIKHRQEYDPKIHKVDRRTFNKEQDYLEELRAKDFALSVVGGLFPKADKTIRGTRASYEKDFARHLSLSNNPELIETYLKKYPELNRFIERVSVPGENDILLVSDDNYYGQGQPRIRPDSSFLKAAMSEDITAMNEYHASFNYMLDKFKYLAAQLFVDAEKPEYKSGYTASKGK